MEQRKSWKIYLWEFLMVPAMVYLHFWSWVLGIEIKYGPKDKLLREEREGNNHD